MNLSKMTGDIFYLIDLPVFIFAVIFGVYIMLWFINKWLKGVYVKMKQDKISDQMKANKMIDGTIENIPAGQSINLASLSLRVTKVCDVSMNYIRKRVHLHAASDPNLTIEDGVTLERLKEDGDGSG